MTLFKFRIIIIIIIIIFDPQYQLSQGRFEKISENKKAGYV